jgi:hypothetical protein
LLLTYILSKAIRTQTVGKCYTQMLYICYTRKRVAPLHVLRTRSTTDQMQRDEVTLLAYHSYRVSYSAGNMTATMYRIVSYRLTYYTHHNITSAQHTIITNARHSTPPRHSTRIPRTFHQNYTNATHTARHTNPGSANRFTQILKT